MMYQIFAYVPESQLEAVKEAMFAEGAGAYSRYDRCSWEVRGCGQYRPLAGSQPYAGSQGTTEHAVEYRLEMICMDTRIEPVLRALLAAHPYEQPAYGVMPISTIKEFS